METLPHRELEAIERERARRRQIELAGKRNSDLEATFPQGEGTTRRAPQPVKETLPERETGECRKYFLNSQGEKQGMEIFPHPESKSC